MDVKYGQSTHTPLPYIYTRATCIEDIERVRFYKAKNSVSMMWSDI